MSADIACPATGDDPSTLEAEAAEHERQLRELLEFSPAAIGIVDETGRLLFHNARLREIFGYSQSEFHLFDTRLLWHDLDQRARIIEQLRARGGQVLNEKVIWRTKKGALVHLLLSYVQVAYRGGHISFVGGKRDSDSTQYTRNFHANHGVGFEAYGYARLPFSSSVSESVKLPDALLNGRSSDCVANADHGSN